MLAYMSWNLLRTSGRAGLIVTTCYAYNPKSADNTLK
jgi:hypothetical protein